MAALGDSVYRYGDGATEDHEADEFDEAFEGISNGEEEEKDETEVELERLVFGDKAGFRDEIGGFRTREKTRETAPYALQEDEEDDNNLALVNSADLFFLDAGPSELPEGTLLPTVDEEDDELALRRDPPAWQDSDDERMMVSLMSVPRLRKLRNFEGEDVISGRDYVKRLRRQFELLHPRPQWASWNGMQKNPKKRRRTSSMSSTSSQAASDASLSHAETDGDITVAPLAKLLRTSTSLTRNTSSLPKKRVKLKPQTISIEHMKDISPTQPAAITSLSIHPRLPLILSSGISSTLFLHHLHPHPTPPDSPNPLITSLHLKHTPLTTSVFAPQTTTSQSSSQDSSEDHPQIYLSSRRRYFHTWSLSTGQLRKTTRITGAQSTQRSFEILKPSPCGRYLALLGSTKKAGAGVVNILSAATHQWHSQCVLESRKGLADFVWWGDGRGVCVVGKGGEVAEYDVEEKRIVARWQDQGAVGTTTVAMGGRAADQRKKNAPPPMLGPDRWIAVGSTAGIVNVYERSAWTWANDASAPATAGSGAQPIIRHPTPKKALDNLTTPISHLVFSPCGQLLSMSSRWKRDALRLVHLPSCTVYQNWPTSRTPLGRISAVALGEYEKGEGGKGGEGKVMCLLVGNEAGNLRGWEIVG